MTQDLFYVDSGYLDSNYIQYVADAESTPTSAFSLTATTEIIVPSVEGYFVTGYIDGTYFVDTYTFVSTESSQFTVSASAQVIKSTAVAMNAAFSIGDGAVPPLVIKSVTVAMTAAFTQTCTAKETRTLELFAFSNAQIAIQVSRIRNNNAQLASQATLSAQANRTLLFTSTEPSAFTVSASARKTAVTPAALSAAFSLGDATITGPNVGQVLKLVYASATLSSAFNLTATGTKFNLVPEYYKGLQGFPNNPNALDQNPVLWQLVPGDLNTFEIGISGETSNNYYIVSRNKFTGNVTWTKKIITGTGTGGEDPPVGSCYDGKLYVGLTSHISGFYFQSLVMVFDQSTGTKIAEFNTGMASLTGLYTDSSGIYASGKTYYAPHSYACLVKIDYNNSYQRLWAVSATTTITGITGEQIYVSNNHVYWKVENYGGGPGDIELYQIDRDAGTINWTRDLKFIDGTGSIVVDSNENLYVSGPTGTPTNVLQTIVKILANGTVAWAKKFDTSWSTPILTIDNENNLYVIGDYPVRIVLKLDTNGAPVWAKQGPWLPQDIEYNNGYVYFGGYNLIQGYNYTVVANLPIGTGNDQLINIPHRSPLTGTWSWTDVAVTLTSVSYNYSELTGRGSYDLPTYIYPGNFTASSLTYQVQEYLNTVIGVTNLSTTAQFTALVDKVKTTQASLTASATVSITATKRVSIGSNFTASATVSAVVNRIAAITGSLTSSAQLSETTHKITGYSAQLTSTGELNAVIQKIPGTNIQLSAVAVLSVQIKKTTDYRANLTSQAELSATITRIQQGQATLTTTGSELIAAVKVSRGLAILNADVNLTVQATKRNGFVVAMQSSAQLTETTLKVRPGSANLTSLSTLVCGGIKTKEFSATLASTFTTSITTIKTARTLVALQSTALVTVTATRTLRATAQLQSSAQVTAQMIKRTGVVVNLQATAQLQLTPRVTRTTEIHLQAFVTEVVAALKIHYDPWYNIDIVSESRQLQIHQETRLLTIISETRVNTIKGTIKND